VFYQSFPFDDLEEDTYGDLWWLAISPHGSRLLLVYTHGVTDNRDPAATADSVVDYYGRTVNTYASGFNCAVFSMDTR
jgi:hypothetical protein